MSILPLVLWPDPRLSRNCDAIRVVDDTISGLAKDMLETMYHAGGRGLAAPQVGQMLRLFVMDPHWKTGAPEQIVMINPSIMARESTQVVMSERCLSIPELDVEVERPVAVTVQWTSETGEIHMNDFDGAEARIIQHEMDHLNGVVTLDHLTPERREAVLQGYHP